MVYAMYLLEELLDWEEMKPYVDQVQETVKPFGGRYLANDAKVEVIEGTYAPKHTVIIEFPDRESVDRWYNSAVYQAILPLRLKGAKGAAIVVHGM